MKTNVAFDKFCDTMPVIKKIVDKAKANPIVLGQLKQVANAKSKVDYLVTIPPFLKSCKEEVFEVLAIWNEKSSGEISEQEMPVTIKQIIDIFGDKNVMGFFSSSGGNAQENTDTDEPLTSSEITEENSQTESMTYEALSNTFPTE